MNPDLDVRERLERAAAQLRVGEPPIDRILRQARRRRLRMGATASSVLLALVGLAWGLAVISGLGRRTTVPETRPHILAAIPVDRSPAMVAVGEGAVWVATFEGKPRPVLLRIDPLTNRIVATTRIGFRGAGLGDLAVGAGAVWVSAAGTVNRIDPRTDRVVARIHLPSPSTLAVGFGSLWVGDFNGDSIVRVDPATNRPVARIPIQASPWSLVTGEGYLWVLDNQGSVEKIDPATSRVIAVFGHHLVVDSEGSSFDLAVSDSGVWITYSNALDADTDRLIRIDSRTGAVTKAIDLRGATVVAVGPDGVWATTGLLVTVTAKAIHRYSEGVVRIDPTTGQIVQRIAVRSPADIAVGDGNLWVLSSLRRGMLYKIGPLSPART